MLTANFRGGDQRVVSFLVETAAYPTDGATLPAVPTGTPAIIGYYNTPSLQRSRSNRKGKTAGSPFAVSNNRGVRTWQLGVDLRPGNVPFLQYCVRSGALPGYGAGATGYKGLPNLCLFIQNTGTYGTGDKTVRVLRFCSCAELSLGFQENADTLTANARFMALYEEPAPTVLTDPLEAAIASWGNELGWANVLNVNVGSVPLDLRTGLISGLNIHVNNNLEGKGVIQNTGTNAVRAYGHYAIRPGSPDVTVDGTLHDSLDPSLVKTAVTHDEWGDIYINSSNAAAGGTVVYKTTVKNFLLSVDEETAVDAGAQLGYSFNGAADDVVILNA